MKIYGQVGITMINSQKRTIMVDVVVWCMAIAHEWPNAIKFAAESVYEEPNKKGPS